LVFALSLSFLTLATACRDDKPSPGTTGGSGGSGGRGGSGTGGTGGRGGTGGTAGRDGGPDGSDGPPAGSIQLKITWWGSPDRDMRTQKAIDMFTAKNPNITFVTEHYASTQGAVGMGYWPTLLKHADDKTLPDIMQHDYAYIEEWTAKGLLANLDPLIADGSLVLADVPQALIDGGKVGGKVMGIALGLNTQTVVIDADAFYEAGIPIPPDTWTWDDFERIARQLKERLNVWGAGSGLHGYTPGWKAVYLSKNQWVWSPDGKALGYTDDAPWIAHWKMLLRLQAAGAIPHRWEEPVGSNVEAMHMVMRRSAMEHVHSNQLVALWKASGEQRNLKILPLPKVAGGISPIYMKPAQYFSITATSKYPKEAAKFIDFFTNNVEANMALGGERGVPINTKVLAALKPTLSRQARESFDIIERGAAYATKLPPNDPVAWTTILTQIFGPKVVEPVMNLTWTPEVAVALFRKEASEVLAGKMVPDSGVPDVTTPEAGSFGDARMWDATKDMPPPSEAGTDTAPTPDTSGDAGPNPVTFFVTSIGSGVMGGNLGGLAGADAKCEALAVAVGAGGRGWKAFLSAEAGAITPAVNAKDRIGAGPWRNQRGQMIAANVAALIATPPAANLMIDEKGGAIPVDWHEVLTGTRADGTVYAGRTCSSWTATTGQSQAGIATDADPTQRFSSHVSGCTQAALENDGNQGRIYCFASTP
jgi:multiple sugar transport system substrate-binding protein